jgi:anti-sigma factor RsiW
MQMTNYPLGWKCAAISLRFERYLSGDLPRAELLAVAAHLEMCELCLERLMAYRVAIVVASTPKHARSKSNARRGKPAASNRKGKGRRG